MKRTAETIVALVAIALMTACVGDPYRFANVQVDPGAYEELGYAEASTQGTMILTVIPSRMNDKIQRVISAAIESKGGDELVDITVQERWWGVGAIVSGYGVNVKGMVLKKK